MTRPPSTVQAEFDQIARLTSDADETWNHNNHYHNYLLSHLPMRCPNALEIGCGMGAFSRLLAQRADRVLALDLSPEMLRVAQERSTQYPHIQYECGDALTWDFGVAQFDAIASIATLHHLPLEPMLLNLKAALKPGGVLVVLDLFKGAGLTDWRSIAGVPASLILKWLKNGRLRDTHSPALQAAWTEHGDGDVYLPIAEVRHICDMVLPKAQVRQHILWRYSMVWKNAL